MHWTWRALALAILECFQPGSLTWGLLFPFLDPNKHSHETVPSRMWSMQCRSGKASCYNQSCWHIGWLHHIHTNTRATDPYKLIDTDHDNNMVWCISAAQANIIISWTWQQNSNFGGAGCLNPLCKRGPPWTLYTTQLRTKERSNKWRMMVHHGNIDTCMRNTWDLAHSTYHQKFRLLWIGQHKLTKLKD